MPFNTNSVPTWRQEQMQRASARAKDFTLPTSKDESWRYTPISRLELSEYSMIERPFVDYEIPAEVKDVAAGADGCLLFYNGHFVREASQIPNGVELFPMSEALRGEAGHGDRLRTLCDRAPHGDLKLIGELNRAHFSEGYYIVAKKDSQAKIVVMNLFGHVVADSVQQPFVKYLRNVLVAESGSEVEFFDLQMTVDDNPMFVNAATDFRVESGAKVVTAHSWWFGNSAIFVNDHFCSVERDAALLSSHFMQGGKLVRNQLSVDLVAEGAEVTANGIYRVTDDQHIDTSSDIRHLKGLTKSSQTYKGVLSGKGRAVFSGRLEIFENAQKSDAYQLNRNLLLGQGAEANTKPQLLVNADDVKAAHGASVGQLNADEIFYLTSRGIARSQATRMIADGFENEILNKVGSSFLAEKLNLVAEKARRQWPLEIES